jgi:hypothetical protein
MNKITISFDKKNSKTVIAPESWNDLDRRTLLLFYSTMFTALGSEANPSAFTALKLITMTQHILGVDNAFMLKWEADCATRGSEFLSELAQVIDASLPGLLDKKVDDEGNTAYSVRFNLTKNPYPALSHTAKHKGGKSQKINWVYAPKDGLENISIYEMAYAFQLYEAYLQTNNEKYSNDLIACLYRPSRPETKEDRASGWFGDRRQPLRKYEAKIEERSKKVAGIPIMARRIIVFWFASCREAIIRQWPQVFKPSEGSIATSGNHWGDLLLSLAETGVFGNLDQTADQHYSNALQLLTKRDNEARELEKKMSKSNRK